MPAETESDEKEVQLSVSRDSKAKELRIQHVWPPNFGGYIWDHEKNDSSYPRRKEGSQPNEPKTTACAMLLAVIGVVSV
jgi:hypothetical protein